MLQTVEGEMLRIAVRVLGELGCETGALIADGLLARNTRVGPASSCTAVEALRNATVAVQDRIWGELGIAVNWEW
eukprot:5484129-Prymnesium_polylepis.2